MYCLRQICTYKHVVGVLIATGEFGIVYRGNLSTMTTKGEQRLVAVKTLKGTHVCTIYSKLHVSLLILHIAKCISKL